MMIGRGCLSIQVLHFFTEGVSDHCPCIIKMDSQIITRPKPFRFFNMWSQSENFMEIVQTDWQRNVQGCAMFQVVTKLKRMK